MTGEAPADRIGGCPDVDERFLRMHCSRLPERYFEVFSREQVCHHAQTLAGLTPDRPVRLLLEPGESGLECTVCAFDYPSAFSLITGILASVGYNIAAGSVFTYAPAAAQRRSGHEQDPHAAMLARRRIVDRFVGRPREAADAGQWAGRLERPLQEIFVLLEGGGREDLAVAKQRVNEMVAARLADIDLDSFAALYPLHSELEETASRATRIKVVSEDTPFFLYSFSTALTLRGISIESVQIETRANRIEDTFELVDAAGAPLDPRTLDQVRLSLLLTKQFTYFLTRAPDPYAALTRFESLIEDILQLPEQGRWVDLLSNPRVMQDLAKLLGTSDFLWEDFIRTQYENLIPMLGPQVEGRSFSSPPEDLAPRLRREMAGATDPDEEVARLNAFKDREIYLIDLDHILNPDADFRALSGRLTRLAEAVIEAAFESSWTRLVARVGEPMAVAGLTARYAILGVGKLGGQALGYASDIEFIVVYSDSGETAGPAVIPNAEFFETLVQEAVSMIHAKREGIFHVDLRLRPHGGDGPLAASLDGFSHYYDRNGPAHSFEKLALLRMRAIGGDPAFGTTLERLRDRMVYSEGSIRLAELRALREKQLQEKSGCGRLNAKFSRGALVDLEYAVQILQVIHGGRTPRLRTPSIHRALDGLAEGGIIRQDEAQMLVSAYRFLRNLINALRMLRGSAQDLLLPDKDSIEFSHLARRMGYSRRGFLPPETALRLDFETATASIRAFVERYFGQETLPGPGIGNVADLVLSEETGEDAEAMLRELRFSEPSRALTNLRNLAGRGEDRGTFARLAILACEALSRTAAPDMALNNWDRFVERLPDATGHYKSLLDQPAGMDILLRLFAGSQFLSDTLIRYPEVLPWLVDPEVIHAVRTDKEFRDELRLLSRETADHEEWLAEMRRFRRRQILRTGTRDLVLGKPLAEITTELTRLADAVTAVALERIWAEHEESDPARVYSLSRRFCILALGKLGGQELNYSSDIDLFGLHEEDPETDGEDARRLFQTVMGQLRADLSRHTDEGSAYRIDLRLRPYGRSGPLVQSTAALLEYYRRSAGLWELQALIKARPLAGASDAGRRFLDAVTQMIRMPRSGKEIAESIARMRDQAVQTVARTGDRDVKSGLGGIRDVEFLVQGLQLMHSHRDPDLLVGGTVRALDALEQAQVLDSRAARELTVDYTFMRRVEHAIQILDDQQRHATPERPEELDALAKRVLGEDATAESLTETLSACQTRIRAAYEKQLAALAASG